MATVPFGSMNPISEIVQRADRFQQRTPWLAFPVAVWKKFSDDRAGNLAALIAYNGFASVFPLLLVLVTVLDITMKNYPGVKSSLEHSALAQYPVIGPEILSNVHSLSGRGLPLAVGLEADREAHLMYAVATQRDRAETIEVLAPDSAEEKPTPNP